MNVEKVYEAVAALALCCSVNLEKWGRILVTSKIYGKMCEIKILSENNGDYETLYLPDGKGRVLIDANKGMLFLRDDLIKTTGQRIWGLTFTLWPNGKFNIEYDYNKPDDYDDTDELISGDEINKSIDGLRS
jgi:hypothetical protein